MKELKIAEVVEQLEALGVKKGGVLVVHSSFRNIRPIEGGVEGLIEALRLAVGPEGTLVMPSMTDDDEHVFSATETPCSSLGIVPDTFWRMPGVLRSDSPHSFAAIGKHAAQITAPHPVEIPHGLDSPVGRVYELDGQVLLLGVSHEANTTIHLAENLADVPYRVYYSSLVLKDSQPIWVDYGEVDHCGEKFELVDEWLTEKGLQTKGSVGHGSAILCRSRDVVQVVMAHLAQDKLAFLHAPGSDPDCDAAHASISLL